MGSWRTHEIDTDDQLGLGAPLAGDLCHALLVVGHLLVGRHGRGVGLLLRLALRRLAVGLLGRIARRPLLGRVAHGLAVLRRVSRVGGVDGRQRAVGAALLLLARLEPAGRGIRVGRRAAEGVVRVHLLGGLGQAVRAGVGGLRGERGWALRVGAALLGRRRGVVGRASSFRTH